MSRMKKFIALALALSMTAAIVACGSGSGGSSSSSSESKKSESSQASSGNKESQPASSTDGEEEDLGVWAPLPETVTITTALTESTVDVGFVEGEDYGHNIWYDRYLDLFNVQVENEWTVMSTTDYESKINMCIADGDLPDVFMLKKLSQFNQVVDAGLAMDITDVYEQYASDLVKSYMDGSPELVKSVYKDGKMYGLPSLSYGIIDQPFPLWIRKDWRLEQNLDPPETWDDVVNILQVFHDKYGATLGMYQNLRLFFKMGPIWGAYPQTWIRTDNGVEYGGIQPEVKNMLAAMKDLYDKGLLSDQFVEWDSSKFKDLLTQDAFGVYVQDSWYDQTFTNVVKEKGFDSNNYCEAFPLPSATGEKVMYPINYSNYDYIVINSKCEHPEAVMKVLNLFPQVIFEGNEGAYGEISDEVWAEYNRINPVVVDTLRIFDPQCDFSQHYGIVEAIKTGDESGLKGLGTLQKWSQIKAYLDDPDNAADDTVRAGFFQLHQVGGEMSAYAVSGKILTDGDYFYNVLFGENPASLDKLGSTLDSILLEGYTKIIIGDEPLDYFEELVESWKKAGGEQVTKEMNEMYGE